MELLVVIHHPSHDAVRPAEALAAELASVYDRVMGAAAARYTRRLAHATVILLAWPARRLGWVNWHQDGQTLLATAGLPLLHCPAGEASALLTPARLSRLIGEAATPRGLGDCGGYFAAARVDAAGGVRLVTNYLAEVPLYRAEQGGITVWSNKAAAAALLAGLEPRLDRAAAREFILLGHPLGERTLWEGVSLEPPATCIDLTPHGLARRAYLDLPGAYFARRGQREAVARQVVRDMKPLAEALRDAGEEARLHLSGGLDSRAVAAILRHHGCRPACLTHNVPNREVPAARRLARRLGMPYRTVAAQTPTLETFLRRAQVNLWQADGLCSLKYLACRDDLELVRDGRYLPLEGSGGEIGRGYYFSSAETMAQLAGGDLEVVARRSLGNRGALWPRAEEAEAVRQAILLRLGDDLAAGLDPLQASTLFYADQRVRRWAAARRNAGWQWMIDPLKMPCWVYPAMSADPEDQRDERLIGALIAAAWPAAAGVPTVSQLERRARVRRVAGNRLVRGALATYDRLRGPPPESPTTRGLRALRGGLLATVRDAEPHLAGWLDARVAEGWLAAEPWSYDHTELFWHTLTVATWCREFLGQPPAIGSCLGRGVSRSAAVEARP